MKTDKILIIADDSPSAVKAIKYGFNLARELGAKVVLLSVIEPVFASGNPDAGIFPDDALIAAQANTEDFLNRMKKEYGSGVETELLWPIGDIQTTVIDIAAKQNVSLVVMGTHGRKGLSKLLNSSVAESIIHHSPVPVCVVPMDK
jgi:nucleotide-binding universal stress UspA family protein